MTTTNTPLYTELQADVERVLALSKLVADTPWSRGNYEAAAVALIGDHGATISAMAELLEMAQSRVRELETRQSSAAAVNAWRAVDTANTALAERLAVAEERVRVLVETLDNIGGLSRALRSGGPDPMDLHGLSDALSEAVDSAHHAIYTAGEEA